MLKGRWGRVINITSVVGETGQAGQANYAASKAGLIGLTKSLARELASRTITVNAVAPGYIETAMTSVLTEDQRTAMTSQVPLGRAGTDRDVAAAVAFLASEEAGYITGHTLERIHIRRVMIARNKILDVWGCGDQTCLNGLDPTRLRERDDDGGWDCDLR
jgi:3-oxoacyl-[acyl-carrier protein] reductase